MGYPAVREMYVDSIDTKPVDYDWPGEKLGDDWEYFPATKCEKCGAVVLGRGGEKHSDADDESECDGWLSEQEGPMMSYWYPLEIRDTDDAARKLADTCLVVVEVNGKTGLALTGGGMDLSWEICEAFMMLGSLPPLHFADLPAMGGRGTSKRDRWIAAGCLRTCKIAAEWAKDRAARIRKTMAWSREQAAKRAAK